MKILLIYPPLTLHKLDVSPPSKSALMGLGYIAAVLKKASHTVEILDCMVSSNYSFYIDSNFRRFGLSDNQILQCVKAFQPDVVGISCMFTSYFKDAHRVAKIVKEHNGNILVIFGGPHASTFPEQTMKDKNIDVLVYGEGEDTILNVMDRHKNRMDFNGVKGVMHRSNGALKKEEPNKLIENLDDIPFPAWDLLERDMSVIRREHLKNKFLMRKPVGYILTSRGCPKECYFCSVKLMWSRRWRMRSAKNVVDEIEFLKNKYGYREFHFVDDNSSVSKKRMYELCDELMRRKLNVKLVTPTGIAIETLDREILAKMKKAGFYRLCFGLESGSPESQAIIKKRIDLKKAKEVVRDANKLGFWTAATFIIGFPHETNKDIKMTINFAKRLNLDFAIFYLLVPQVGTEVYDIMKRENLIDLDKYIDPDSDEWYKISITYCNGFKTSNFSNNELQNKLSDAYKEFLIHKAFSPFTYLNLLRKIKSLEDLTYMMRLLGYPAGMLKKMMGGEKLSNVTMQEKKLKQIDV